MGISFSTRTRPFQDGHLKANVVLDGCLVSADPVHGVSWPREPMPLEGEVLPVSIHGGHPNLTCECQSCGCCSVDGSWGRFFYLLPFPTRKVLLRVDAFMPKSFPVR